VGFGGARTLLGEKMSWLLGGVMWEFEGLGVTGRLGGASCLGSRHSSVGLAG
jgi:hypothetical protein